MKKQAYSSTFSRDLDLKFKTFLQSDNYFNYSDKNNLNAYI